ncbi:MAG: universal stress protein [Anaerolineales bacterium]|nr:universal stress protein [Anaerolineales bacterium]
MYQKILVPLDGSTRAEGIMPHVEALASCMGATVILLHVVTPPMMLIGPYDMLPVDDTSLVQEQTDAAAAYLAEWQAKLTAEGIRVRVVVEPGAVVAAILDVAAREQADLVAMASHGRTGLARAFYGSVAAGVLHQVDRPLLLIRA